MFSTLHTNDAPSAITRLLDMGVKPFLVASAVRAAMAQRLVRAICTNCKEAYTPTERDLKMLGAIAKTAPERMYIGRGCSKCNGGYKGRKGIFEIFKLDDEIQQMIFDNRPARDLRARAREMGMRTLREDGMLKVARRHDEPPGGPARNDGRRGLEMLKGTEQMIDHELKHLLQATIDEGGSDLHIRAYMPPELRVHGELEPARQAGPRSEDT